MPDAGVASVAGVSAIGTSCGVQTLDLHDGLSVEFRKHANDGYVPIERLAHGQKCTAILIIALADGTDPLIIDQPEDALHAPWIEEYLAAKLRDLRGGRQYIFATRSPGLVVSADTEMTITLTSDAKNGVVEATSSQERHDLNALTLYHLEGGPVPFKRRTVKLGSSMNQHSAIPLAVFTRRLRPGRTSPGAAWGR
jgi:hypothetical protein